MLQVTGEDFMKQAIKNGTLGYVGVIIGFALVHYILKGNLDYLVRGWKILLGVYVCFILLVTGYYELKKYLENRKKKQ